MPSWFRRRRELVSAVLIFGILLGFFALPQQLRPSADVPLMLYIAPQLEQSVFGTSLGSMGDDSVVIEAYVDANGRVEDYRILSQSDDCQSRAAGSEEPADLHDLPSGAFHGRADLRTSSDLFFEDQRERVESKFPVLSSQFSVLRNFQIAFSGN